MRTIHLCALLALLAGLILVPRVVRAQTGAPLSDFLTEIALDHNKPAGADDVPLTPPALTYSIPEGAAEEPAVYPFPGRIIDFREAVGASSIISDRLIISPYEVSVVSDDNPNGLPRRQNAVVIPAAALETFLPFSVIASSDGNVNGTANQESDHLTIVLGSYGAGTGTTDFDESIFEPPVVEPPDPTEPALTHLILPIMFDVIEPPGETGGVQGIVSDYVDILTTIQVQFISSDLLQPAPNLSGFVFENVETGGGVSYALGFHSDAVPEPATWILLGLGVLPLALVGCRRSRRWVDEC